MTIKKNEYTLYRKKILKSILRIVVVLLIAFVLLVGLLFFQVEQAGVKQSLNKSDAAIVLGSAVWEEGKPSPTMQARVNEAVDLYNKAKVDKIILSGGRGKFPPAEAVVMEELAIDLGVKKEDIILERKSTSTRENITYSYLIGEEYSFKTYIIVSDAFHLKRAGLIAKDLGMVYQTAPALESPLYTNKLLKAKYTLRESLALIKFYAIRS